jgi:hypothetical protein
MSKYKYLQLKVKQRKETIRKISKIRGDSSSLNNLKVKRLILRITRSLSN